MGHDLDVLLADGIIDEVLGRLKSGKEADISLVRRGEHVLAAKVYKDRATRSFKNNADYKEGRTVRNSRTQRAIDGGGRFGRDAAEQAWKSAEADALGKLVGSGVRVPQPVMFYEGVLLMELVVDGEGRPAPRMIDVAIAPDQAVVVYADLVAQLIAMLCRDVIHGDLSPYNILAGHDGPTIIDFPQVISAAHNSRAEFFFLRDFDNVVRFVAGFDPTLAPHAADGRAIWRAYVSRDLTPDYVPPPPPPPRATRGPDRRGPPPRREGGWDRGGRPGQGQGQGQGQGAAGRFDRGAPPRGGAGGGGMPRGGGGGAPQQQRGGGGGGGGDRGRSGGARPGDPWPPAPRGGGGAPPQQQRGGGGGGGGDRGRSGGARPGDPWPPAPRGGGGAPPQQRGGGGGGSGDRGRSGGARPGDPWPPAPRGAGPGDRTTSVPRADRPPPRDLGAMPPPPRAGRPPPPRADRPPPPSGGHRRRPKRRW